MISMDGRDPFQVLKVVSYGATALASAALLVGAAVQGSWGTGLAVVAVGALAITTISKDWGRPLGAMVFASFVLLAGREVLGQVYPLWGLLAVTAAMIAWDLGSFRARLTIAGSVAHPEALVRKHLSRLAQVALVGFGLGAVGLFVRVDYGIGTVVGLALLLVLGLSQVIAHVRRESD